MQHFDPNTQSHLLRNFKHPEQFITAYNHIVDDLNKLEENRKQGALALYYKDFKIEDVLDIRPEKLTVFIGINDNHKIYPDAALLQLEILMILNKYMDLKYTIQFREH